MKEARFPEAVSEIRRIDRDMSGLIAEAISLCDLSDIVQDDAAVSCLSIALLRRLTGSFDDLSMWITRALFLAEQDGGALGAKAPEGGEASGGPGGCNPHAEEAHRAGPEALQPVRGDMQ